MTALGWDLTQWLGVVGVLILVIAVSHWLVQRKGGWGALRRRIAREIRLTARAFSEPVRAQLRYRRRVRFLTGLLRDRAGWADAERAVRRVARLRPDFRPFGVLLGPDWVGLLMAGGIGETGGRLPEPWVADAVEPRLWWIPRVALAATEPVAADGRDGPDGPTGQEQVPPREAPPLLVCVGTDGYNAVLLDLYAGPATVSVYGVSRTARAVVQTIGAQLDARLPAGSVEVTAGVHPHHHGRTVSAALADPGSEFVVSAEPAGIELPSGVRMVSQGVGRGRATLLEADAEGLLRLHGAATSWSPDVLPLPRAVARVVAALPPYPAADDDDPPVRGVGRAGAAAEAGLLDDLDELRTPRADVSAVGVSAVATPGGGARAVSLGDDDFSEAGPAVVPAGVSASAGTRPAAPSAAARTREASRSNPRRTQGTT